MTTGLRGVSNSLWLVDESRTTGLRLATEPTGAHLDRQWKGAVRVRVMGEFGLSYCFLTREAV